MQFILGSFQSVCNSISRKIVNRKRTLIFSPTTLHDVAIHKQMPHRAWYSKVDFFLTDGMPLAWWFAFTRKDIRIGRVYGPDMMKQLLQSSQLTTLHHHFLAANVSACASMEDFIKKNYPLLQRSSFDSLQQGNIDDIPAVTKKIKRNKPDIIWIGVGSPRQIELAAYLKKELPFSSCIMCVGAAFDFLPGLKKQAPHVMQRFGLEWLFRLISEPKRLWKRYLVIVPLFLLLEIGAVLKRAVKK